MNVEKTLLVAATVARIAIGAFCCAAAARSARKLAAMETK